MNLAKKIFLVTVPVVFFSAGLAAYAGDKSLASVVKYNPSQLEKFISTNSCENCDLSGVDFSQYTTKQLNHSGADLQGVNLSKSDLHGMNLSGANLENANLSNTSSTWSNANFCRANLNNAVLTGARLVRSDFSQSNLSGASFYEANLEQANFYGAKNANLTGADVCDAILPDGSKGKCN